MLNIIILTPWVIFLFYFSILIHCSCMYSFQTSSNTWLHVPQWSNLIWFCLCSFIVSLLNSLLMLIYALGLLCCFHGIFTYCLFVCSCGRVIFQSYLCHLYITFCFYLVQNKSLRVPCIRYNVFVGRVPIRKQNSTWFIDLTHDLKQID